LFLFELVFEFSLENWSKSTNENKNQN